MKDDPMIQAFIGTVERVRPEDAAEMRKCLEGDIDPKLLEWSEEFKKTFILRTQPSDSVVEAADALDKALGGMLTFYGMDEEKGEVSGVVHESARKARARYAKALALQTDTIEDAVARLRLRQVLDDHDKGFEQALDAVLKALAAQPRDSELLGEEDLRAWLLDQATPSLSAWCKNKGVNRSHANEFANGKRGPASDLLQAIGAEKVYRIDTALAPTTQPDTQGTEKD